MNKNKQRSPVAEGRAFSDKVKQSALGRWPFILQALGMDAALLDGKHRPCPGCGGKDRFQMTVRGVGAEWGRFSCRGHEHGGGDGFALVQHVLDCSFPEAVRYVAGILGLGNQPFVQMLPRPVIPAKDDRETEAIRLQRSLAVINRLWREALPITPDDAAGLYLASRGLDLAAPYPDSLRYHPCLQHWSEDGSISSHPALLCHVSTPASQLIALQRIYLNDQGKKADVDSPKKLIKGADLSGASVRLGAVMNDALCVCEGVETALAVQALTGESCWAGVTAWGLQNMEIPDQVKRVFIMGDHDAAGIKAAHTLKARLQAEGRTAFVKIPTPPHCSPAKGYDWLDELNRLQQEARP